MDPIEIRLRFREPQEVVTLLEIVGFAVDDAAGCYNDNDDPADAIVLGDYQELQDALWQCFREQGFEIRGVGSPAQFKVFYKGERITYQRRPAVEPILKEDT